MHEIPIHLCLDIALDSTGSTLSAYAVVIEQFFECPLLHIANI